MNQSKKKNQCVEPKNVWGQSGEKKEKGKRRAEKKYDRRHMRRMYHKLDKTMAHWAWSSTSSKRHSLLQTLGPCMNMKSNGTVSFELETKEGFLGQVGMELTPSVAVFPPHPLEPSHPSRLSPSLDHEYCVK